MSADAQLDALVRGLDARKSGEQYAAKCPAHDDAHASLSLGKPNGKIVFKCHAGCTQDEIISALRARGLWPNESNKQIVATYDYTNQHGVLVFQAVRYEPKDFRQRRPDGMGGWIWNLRGVKVIPYNLPNVVAAIARGESIAIVEGEKDVESLRKIGITATANAGGAGKWRRDHSQYLRGAKAIILPDNDDPGREHAKQVAQSLAGIAAEVKIVELPGLPPKGDVSVWLANGGTREQLNAFCSRAQESHVDAPASRFPHVWIDDAAVELTNDDYIKNLIGRRAFVLIYGPSGDGKTFFTIDMFAHVASGIDWRGRRVRACLVIYIAAEAGVSIVRRFFAWREHRMGEAREGRIPLAIITRGANLLNMVDVEALIAELRQIAVHAGLPIGAVVFDTFSRSIAGGDENAAVDVTRAIETVDRIRDELDAGCAFVHHSGKDVGRGARGHSSLFAAADTVLSVVERVAVVEKARDGLAGEQFAFDLQVVDLGQDQDGDPITTCVVVPADSRTAQKPAVKLSSDEQVALDTLREELGTTGEMLPQTSVIPLGTRAVRVENWRTRFHARVGDTRELEQAAKRQAWHRGRKGLIAKHVATCWEEFAWLTA